MKRKNKIVCGILIIILLTTIFSFDKVLSAQQSDLTNNVKILQNVERSKFAAKEELEINIQKYSKDKKELVNVQAEKALKLHNLSYEDISKSNEINVVKDVMLNRTVNRVKTEKVQIDFDQEGNIVKLVNYEDISTVDKDRKDYEEDKPLETTVEYKLKTQDDIEYIINDIVNAYNLEGYKIVNCHNNLVGNWSVVWNKILFDDVVNAYDVVCVTIDAKDGSIMNFIRNSVIPETTNLVITKEQAISFAKPIIDKLDSSNNITATLTTFRPNFYWEENGPYEEADFIRLAWQVVVERNTYIMIDAETGEILGGDQMLGTDGARAMTVVPTFYKAEERTTAATNAFKRLGYVQPYACQPYTGWVNKQDIMWVLNHSSLYGLFLSCHGVYDANNNFANQLTADGSWYLSPSEVTGNWHFVFIAACGSSSTPAFPAAFKTGGFEGRCFVGYNISTPTETSYQFIIRFCSKLGSMPVIDAVVAARDETLAAGYRECDPGFWGDMKYYGTAW